MMEAQVRWLRGERSEAQRAGEECVEVAGRVEPSTFTFTSICNTAASCVDEDPERCIREMTAAAGPMLERVDQSWRTWLLAQLVRAALALDRTEDAERWTAAIEQRAVLVGTTGARCRAATARAGVLLAAGEAAEAARLAGAAADEAALADNRLDALPALLLSGRAHAAAGDRDAAVAALQRAALEAGHGSAGLFVETAARELRRLGTRLSAESRRATAGDDLTERERAIAELVAQGRTNKEVAAALFLSEKTIEHHLSRTYAKLGVRSRVELAARITA
jgi:DNA-binding NarL/FixJ family response regulator